jgi:imidazolonepropionase-like amidohydrolase
VLVEDGVIAWIRPRDDEGETGPLRDLELVDASGATIVPGLVDSHGHVTMPGGARWIDHGLDPAARQLDVAEHNGRAATAGGVRWVRDVGSPRGEDPATGRDRALALVVRDAWATRREMPYLRAAGTWLTRRGTLPAGLTVEVGDADALVRAAERQLDEGADLVKLYMDGPDPDTAPWSAAEVRRVVRLVHGRGAKVTAHAGWLDPARTAVAGGVDSVEHGFVLDADVCREMARRRITLVSTLSVMHSWLTFGRTTTIERFTSRARIRVIRDRLERAEASVRLARAAGVRIAAGSDFGGGSTRAGQLAWEVEALVRAGLEPWRALGAATWRGGQLLGDRDAGRIREGGPADFLLVHGDPLSDPAALWRVWRVAWAEPGR